MEGFINSTPGYKGGYVLAKPAKQIGINKVLKALGGTLFDSAFCGLHTSTGKLCTHSVDCSTRSLWQMIQFTVDGLLDKVTLHHLVNPEKESAKILSYILEQNSKEI
jgi:DNA-binding IscR family transcriptional regulator